MVRFLNAYVHLLTYFILQSLYTIINSFKKITTNIINHLSQKKEVTKVIFYYFKIIYFRQDDGANTNNIGKISNRPANISKDKTSFETSDNDEKFPTGPTTFIPGPTLFKHVATAEKALVKILQKSLSKSLNILELNL